ncbi:DUF6087 family protein [Streptomyces sp. TRM70308]|uniref:DUF6087 family protein n=1 Tax=Streptomyces sp. TRM70308 TaxID=3131932 RepID=UPI003D08577F
MGKHSRPQPSDEPPAADPGNEAADDEAADPLAAYHQRRRPPQGARRRHHPLHGGGWHVLPHAPRALEEWNGFWYEPAGSAPDLAHAQRWVSEHPGTHSPGDHQ